jgi:hypothetical protein
MVATEKIIQDYIMSKYQIQTNLIDIDIAIPPATTLRMSIFFPVNYAFVKIDIRNGLIINRLIQVTLIADQSLIYDLWPLPWSLNEESWRCIGMGSIVYDRYACTITNLDPINTHNFDMTIRGILVPKRYVIDFMNELWSVKLNKETVEELSREIAKNLKTPALQSAPQEEIRAEIPINQIAPLEEIPISERIKRIENFLK